jgi:hypothetical protein
MITAINILFQEGTSSAYYQLLKTVMQYLVGDSVIIILRGTRCNQFVQ